LIDLEHQLHIIINWFLILMPLVLNSQSMILFLEK